MHTWVELDAPVSLRFKLLEHLGIAALGNGWKVEAQPQSCGSIRRTHFIIARQRSQQDLCKTYSIILTQRPLHTRLGNGRLGSRGQSGCKGFLYSIRGYLGPGIINLPVTIALPISDRLFSITRPIPRY